jgi:hypothetical protein
VSQSNKINVAIKSNSKSKALVEKNHNALNPAGDSNCVVIVLVLSKCIVSPK